MMRLAAVILLLHTTVAHADRIDEYIRAEMFNHIHACLAAGIASCRGMDAA